MKKIKVIGKTLLVAAFVASSVQMFASEPKKPQVGASSIFRRQAMEKYKKEMGEYEKVRAVMKLGKTMDWLSNRSTTEQVISAIIATGIIASVAEYIRRRLMAKNPEAGRSADKIREDIEKDVEEATRFLELEASQEKKAITGASPSLKK